MSFTTDLWVWSSNSEARSQRNDNMFSRLSGRYSRKIQTCHATQWLGGVVLSILMAGCLTFETFVPLDACPRGDPPPVSDEISSSCRETVEAALGNETGFDGFVAMRGETVLVNWGDTALPTNVASVRKSIVSLLYGIAADRGLIDLDATLESLEIDDRDQPLTDLERQATVRHLLQSRSGVYVVPLGESEYWAERRPARGAHPPGTHFFYNNWDFNALGTIFEKTTGYSLEQALEDWLATPLEMQTYCQSHVAYEEAGSTEHRMYRFYMSAEDLAKIGVLVAQGGRYNGQQIVSQAWIEESTRPISDVQEFFQNGIFRFYGYLWWLDDQGHIWADGSGGQYIHIDPETKLVTVLRNQTGISVPSYLWYNIAQKDNFGDVGRIRARSMHERTLECL